MWPTRLLECHSDIVCHTTDVDFWSATLEMSTISSVPLEMYAAMEMLVTALQMSTIGVQLEMSVTNADVDLWSTSKVVVCKVTHF